MRVRLLVSTLAVGSALAFASGPVFSQAKKHDHAGHKHTHPTAQNGGVLEDVGEYHAELLVKGGKIALFVRDEEAKDVDVQGFKASVLITAGSLRIGPIELKPAGKGLEAPVANVPAGATAILTLTDKSGVTAQARFKLL